MLREVKILDFRAPGVPRGEENDNTREKRSENRKNRSSSAQGPQTVPTWVSNRPNNRLVGRMAGPPLSMLIRRTVVGAQAC